jgi:AraC-like DNA-binding protein
LEIDVKLQALPGLVMMSGRAHGSRNQRTPEMLALDGSDDVGLLVNLSGPHHVKHGRHEIVLGDGEAALVSLGEVCSFTHRPPGELMALRVARAQLGALVTGIEDKYLRRISSATPALKLLIGYINTAQDGDGIAGPELRHAAAAHVCDLMALAVGATRDAAETAQGRGLRAARLQAIKQDIAENLEQADLAVAAIACRHGCTPRFIQRLFEAEGMTFTEYVLTERLARAYRMLIDPRRSTDKIATIALDAGFADLSYFNRAFRQRYGETPSGVRAQAPQYA